MPWLAEAAPYVPDDGNLVYDIIRKDEPIGQQRLRFERKSGALVIHNEVKIVVRVAIVPVYRYTLSARTELRDGALASYAMTLEDNGTTSSMRVVRDEHGLVIEGPNDEVRRRVPAGLQMNGFWNRDAASANALIDGTKGTIALFSAEPRIREQIQLGGRTLSAWRYRLRGDIAHDLWYDDAGRLLRIRRIARDGSIVRTDLRL